MEAVGQLKSGHDDTVYNVELFVEVSDFHKAASYDLYFISAVKCVALRTVFTALPHSTPVSQYCEAALVRVVTNNRRAAACIPFGLPVSCWQTDTTLLRT
jgi:hypothetical protein